MSLVNQELINKYSKECRLKVAKHNNFPNPLIIKIIRYCKWSEQRIRLAAKLDNFLNIMAKP